MSWLLSTNCAGGWTIDFGLSAGHGPLRSTFGSFQDGPSEFENARTGHFGHCAFDSAEPVPPRQVLRLASRIGAINGRLRCATPPD
jgi:hypothetical protein